MNISFDSATFYQNTRFSFTFGSSAAAGSYFYECTGWVLSAQHFSAPFSAVFQLFQNSSSSVPLSQAVSVSSQSVAFSSAFASSNPDIKVRPTEVVIDTPFVLSVTGKFPIMNTSVLFLSSSCGSQHLCIETAIGAVYCRGRGDSQQLGQDSYGSSHVFQLVPIANLDSSSTQTVVGGSHSCVLKRDSTLRCWGSNHIGQLGVDFVNTSAGVEVNLPAQASNKPSLAALGLLHSCVLFQSGVVWCWGDNSRGQLGIGSVGGNASSAVLVPGLTGVVSIALGGHHTCALTGVATIHCWGSNSFGQLGAVVAIGSNSGSPEVVTGISVASGGSSVASVSLGMAHSCVLFQSGVVWCWGDNSRGQLGIGSVGGYFSSPQRVSAVSISVKVLTVGSYHVCTISVSESVFCFGNNQFGQERVLSTVYLVPS